MYSSILKAIMLKDVDSLPVVLSKGCVRVRNFYAKRQSNPKGVCMYVCMCVKGG